MSSRSLVLTSTASAPGWSPSRSGLFKRQCDCGQHTSGGGKCEQCSKNEGMSSRKPHKAVNASADTREEKPSPHAGDATIQCNGSGGWEIDYGNYAGATCGTKDCVTAHESSHMADWQAKWPTGCLGKPKGYLPKGDPPDSPLMSVSEYNTFLKDSECRAHTADLQCAEALPKVGGCKQTVEDYIELTKKQKANWCGGLPTWAKVLIGLGVAGVVGGIIGAALAHH